MTRVGVVLWGWLIRRTGRLPLQCVGCGLVYAVPASKWHVGDVCGECRARVLPV